MSAVPHYNLESVRKAAKNEEISYSRAAFRDFSNLGLELSDVIKCVVSLTSSDFYKSYDYGENCLFDAYRINYRNPNSESNEADPLYIKFKMLNNYLRIDVASFHRDR